MKYVEVIADCGSTDTVCAIAEKAEAQDFRVGVAGEDGLQQMRMLVADEKLQRVLDALQSILGAQPAARIVVLAVEASLPRQEKAVGSREESSSQAREALYEGVVKNTRLDANYLVLVVLSTIVAAIGLIANNVAVVIGAMVIAPLLGPNLALSLGTALGDVSLMRQSVLAVVVGLLLAVTLSIGLGYWWPTDLSSPELMARTEAGLDSVALALASGAAAALSLTTGLSSVLVGVMVAVALLPPAATLGIMLGHGNVSLAIGAAFLLAINIASVNLASNVVFLVKGIDPRTSIDKRKARRTMFVSVFGWSLLLIALTAIVIARGSFVA